MNPILLLNHLHPQKTRTILQDLAACGQSEAHLYLQCPTAIPIAPPLLELQNQTLEVLQQIQQDRDREGLETTLLIDASSKTYAEAHTHALASLFEKNDAAHTLFDHCRPTKTFFETHNQLLDTQKEKNYLCIGGGFPLPCDHQILETHQSDFSAFSTWKNKIEALWINPATNPKERPKRSREDSLEILLKDYQERQRLLSLTPTCRLHGQTDLDGSHSQPLAVFRQREDTDNEAISRWQNKKKTPQQNPKLEKQIRRNPSTGPLQTLGRVGLLLTPPAFKSLWGTYTPQRPLPALRLPNPKAILPCANTLVAALTVSTLIPCLYTLQLLQKQKSESLRSLQSLKNNWEAINNYTQDFGKPPPPHRWLTHAKTYSEKDLEDPTYQKLTGIAQPDHPGWGMNTKLHHALRLHGPTKAIVLGPSFETRFSPNLDGFQNPQPLSEENPTPTLHNRRLGSSATKPGWSGLYATLSGEILNLNPHEAASLLKTPAHGSQTKDPHWATPKAGFDRTSPDNPPNPPSAPQETRLVSPSEGHSADPHQVLTYQIPVSPQKTHILTLEIESANPQKIEAKLNPLNSLNQIINSTNPQFQTTQRYEGTPYLTLRRLGEDQRPGKIPKRISLVPIEGHSTQTLRGRLVKTHPDGSFTLDLRAQRLTLAPETPVGVAQDFSKKTPIHTPAKQWKKTRLIISPESLPPHTQSLEVTLKSRDNLPFNIRPLEISAR
jgi:hypothetical protein